MVDKVGVVSRNVLKNDPFVDLELDHETDELQTMIARVGIIDSTCSAKELTTADSYLCATILLTTHGMHTS